MGFNVGDWLVLVAVAAGVLSAWRLLRGPSLPDRVLARLKENGGIVMAVGYPDFLSERRRLVAEIETLDLDLGLLAILGASLALCLGVCQKAHKLAHGHVVRQSFELCKQGIVDAKEGWVGVARRGLCRRKITFGV